LVDWALHEAYHGCDFDNGKDEFGFTVGFHAEQVDDDNGDEENGDKYGFW
jgi:hypothetical protein